MYVGRSVNADLLMTTYILIHHMLPSEYLIEAHLIAKPWIYLISGTLCTRSWYAVREAGKSQFHCLLGFMLKSHCSPPLSPDQKFYLLPYAPGG